MSRIPHIFLFKIKNAKVTIIDKHFTTPALSRAQKAPLVARAQIYKSYLEKLAPYLKKQNILLAFYLGDGEKRDPRCPVFCFHKDEGSKSILFPDLDFVQWDFYSDYKYLDLRSFESKENSAIFVGSTTGGLITQTRILEKSHPRLRAAEFFKEVDEVTFELTTICQCDSPETELVLRNLGYGSARKEWDEQLNHKFIISMDGNGATWSRTVAALKSASVLLKYNSKSQLFYFSYLTPWKHYIPISSDEDVLNVVKTEKERPGFFSSIAKNGSEFANKYLTKESVTRYTLGLLNEYSQLVPSFSDELMEKHGLVSSNEIPFYIMSKTGYICSSELGQDGRITCTRKTVRAWEEFRVMKLNEGCIALIACNGKYVSADRNKEGLLIADRNAVHDWELFLVEPYGEYVALKATEGKYVSRREDKNGVLFASAQQVGLWELFKIMKV